MSFRRRWVREENQRAVLGLLADHGANWEAEKQFTRIMTSQQLHLKSTCFKGNPIDSSTTSRQPQIKFEPLEPILAAHRRNSDSVPEHVTAIGQIPGKGGHFSSFGSFTISATVSTQNPHVLQYCSQSVTPTIQTTHVQLYFYFVNKRNNRTTQNRRSPRHRGRSQTILPGPAALSFE